MLCSGCKPCLVVSACNHSFQEAEAGGVQAILDYIGETLSQINKNSI